MPLHYGLTNFRICTEPLPIDNLPCGAKARIRLRKGAFPKVFVRSNSETREYIPEVIDGKFHLNEEYLQGVNCKQHGN